MGTRVVHLIRHGQYHMDKDHRNHGGLTVLGRYQARRVGQRLSEYDVSMIHVSTMKRAQETWRSIAQRLDSVKSRNCELLVEGIPELPKIFLKKSKITKTTKTNMMNTKARMNRAFKKYFQPYKGKGEKHEALICHGNIIRYFVMKALGVDTSKWINLSIFQCSISTVSIDEKGKIRLATFGEIGHIPTEKRTEF